jgi:hypothetical protein
VVIWYILSRFGFLYKEKSGNPDGGDLLARVEAIDARRNPLPEIVESHQTHQLPAGWNQCYKSK